MPDKKLTDNEIIKELQGIKESMKRHIDLTNEMGQDLLRIDEEYTGGSKVWLTTDYFKKVVKHFCHSNYLVKCLELVFDYINRQNAEIEKQKKKVQARIFIIADLKAEIERYRETVGELVVEDDGVVELLKGEKTKYIKEETAEIAKRTAVEYAKSEAYKEFAERLKESTDIDNKWCGKVVLETHIDNLLKELVGEDK